MMSTRTLGRTLALGNAALTSRTGLHPLTRSLNWICLPLFLQRDFNLHSEMSFPSHIAGAQRQLDFH